MTLTSNARRCRLISDTISSGGDWAIFLPALHQETLQNIADELLEETAHTVE
jgi:hypothetical protein